MVLTVPGTGNAACCSYLLIEPGDEQGSAIRNYLIKIVMIGIKQKYSVLRD